MLVSFTSSSGGQGPDLQHPSQNINILTMVHCMLAVMLLNAKLGREANSTPEPMGSSTPLKASSVGGMGEGPSYLTYSSLLTSLHLNMWQI